MTNMPRIVLSLVVLVVACLVTTQPVSAQRKSKKQDTTIRGEVTLKGQKLRSWNGDNLSVDMTKISAKLREYVSGKISSRPLKLARRSLHETKKCLMKRIRLILRLSVTVLL